MSLEIHRGRTETLEGVALNADGDPMPNTVSLTFTIRNSPASSAVLVRKTTGDGIVWGTAGAFTITIDPSDTLTLPNRRQDLVCDIMGTDGNRREAVYPTANITVQPNVTEPYED